MGWIKNILYVCLVLFGISRCTMQTMADNKTSTVIEKMSYSDMSRYNNAGIVGIVDWGYSKSKNGRVVTSFGVFEVDKSSLGKFDIGDNLIMGSRDIDGLHVLCQASFQSTNNGKSCAKVDSAVMHQYQNR